MPTRPQLRTLGLNTGKKARLHRILFQHGLGNGTAMFLPYDQGLEHGPRDFFVNPTASDPAYIAKLAVKGGFNGIALQIGLAEKFYWDYAGELLPGDDVATLIDRRSALADAVHPLLSEDELVALEARIDAIIAEPVFPTPSSERPYPWPLV